GLFKLAGNVDIERGLAATSSFTNQGLLAKTAGSLSTIATQVINTGLVEAASGSLDLQAAGGGAGGPPKVDTRNVLQVDAAVSAGQTVDFNGGNDKLVLTDAAHFAAKVQDFGLGDRLDLRQFDPAATTLAYAGNSTQGVLTVSDGSLATKITL